jgi:GT2 family glycosyltransferase
VGYSVKDVSIILPYIRQEKAKGCIDALMSMYPEVELVAEYDPDRIGVAKMIARLTAKTTRPLVCFMADDTMPLPGFLEAAIKTMETLPDGWGVVGLKTSDYEKERAGHWLAHKNMLPLLGGEFHHTGYQHCYGSNELTDRAIELGRYAKAWDAVIEHNNPVIYGGDFTTDPLLMSVYGPDGNKLADQKIYWRRKRERLKDRLAIGFPLVDETVPVQFFASFACMEKPSQYVLLMPEFPHGPWGSNIADARNSLILQALSEGASHLLMCDTDQIYPANALVRLLSHKKDICGVRVHSRWMPFSPVMYRGELGRYSFIPDAEMYSGDLVEIDATGTGCLLIDMKIFDVVDAPWFQFTMHRDRPVGEDIYFCHKAREAGIKIYVDTSIVVGHMTTLTINEEFHKLCKTLRPRINH